MTAIEIEIEAPMSQVAFDADAMLMYGWVADANRNVRFVSNSLRRWIHNRNVADAEKLLQKIDAGGEVTIKDLLRSLIDEETERETPQMVDSYLGRLETIIGDPDAPIGTHAEHEGHYDVMLQYHPPRHGAQPLAGARFVRNAATLLASRLNAERVDIVVVAIVERRDGMWKVRGFQGQLQEAWLRVRNRIEDGNRAGSIALMARNLSHNIGSHALYWVAAGASEEEKNFLNYLQVRMELLAGFATEMPLSPITANLSTVMDRFCRTRMLLNNICRSERVDSVHIDYQGGPLTAVFFGGEIGIHAFYSILENCIRDSAKFAPNRDTGMDALTMHVVATEEEGFIRIEVFDDAQNYAAAGEKLEARLDAIRISDDGGRLEPHHWGIKERFVCAAMLRGERPEDFPQPGMQAPTGPWLGNFARRFRRILAVTNRDGNCAWQFYLPRPRADILLISDDVPAHKPDCVAVEPLSNFDQIVTSVTELTAPFVVLDALPECSEPRMLEGRLPHRTYVRGTVAAGRFLSADIPIEELSPTALLEKSVQSLTRKPARLVLAIANVDTETILPMGPVPDLPVTVIDECDIHCDVPRLPERRGDEDLIVISRHELKPEYREDFLLYASSRGVRHYEHYSGRPLESFLHGFQTEPARTAYRLLEAALTKILIIDERIDLSLYRALDELRRQELLLRGITVRGSEFAGHSDDRKTELYKLREWGEDFHYILLHRGVSDKLIGPRPDGSTVTVEDVVRALEFHGARVVMHSGRMGISDIPSWTKFVSLANVTTWIERDYSKLQIVEELFSLRKV